MLSIGNAFAAEPVQADRLLVLAVAFAGTVALWWCYFHRAEEVGLEAAGGAADPSRIVAFGNHTLIAMVVGIVAIAVGDELAIAPAPLSLLAAVIAASAVLVAVATADARADART